MERLQWNDSVISGILTIQIKVATIHAGGVVKLQEKSIHSIWFVLHHRLFVQEKKDCDVLDEYFRLWHTDYRASLIIPGLSGSSSIIRKQLLLDIAILPQATAYRPFHTLFALSFLIGCLFLLQNCCCNHMLLHSQQHLYHDLIHLQNSVKLLSHSYCISQ